MALPTRYSKLPARDSEDSIENVLLSQAEWPTQGKRSVTTKAGWSLLVFLVGTMTFAAGLIVGIKSVPSGARSMQASAQNFMSPPGDLSYPMIYNITYTQNSPSSNSLWDAMFPRGVGFVKHPSISPDLSGLAVFHELHCVNILRVGYYAALDGTLEQMQHVADHNKRPDPHHLRHCFDYLRQALVCTADTNLEPVDWELGGVTGWKYERKCRDFEVVKAWADEWRSWPDEEDGELGGS